MFNIDTAGSLMSPAEEIVTKMMFWYFYVFKLNDEKVKLDLFFILLLFYNYVLCISW